MHAVKVAGGGLSHPQTSSRNLGPIPVASEKGKPLLLSPIAGQHLLVHELFVHFLKLFQGKDFHIVASSMYLVLAI